MKKFRFLKFKVYQDAIKFRVGIKNLVDKYFPKDEKYVLGDQILRAATSIVLNIAEGSNRSTDKDFANFLNISHTSVDEVVACLDLARIQKYISDEIFQVNIKEAENLANQLTAFRNSLFKKSKVKSQKLNVSQGFTLIELLVYIALVSIFLSGAIMFSWDVIYGRVKSQVQQEVSYNLKHVVRKIMYETRRAKSVNFVNPTSISLEMDEVDRNPTVFDLANNKVRIGFGTSGDCPVSSPCDLTSDQVSVSALNFSDLSNDDSSNINFSITVESVGERKEWEKEISWEGSIELRSNSNN